jgi:hypothetical protein
VARDRKRRPGRSGRRSRRNLYLGIAAAAGVVIVVAWGLASRGGAWKPEHAARQEYAPYAGPLRFPDEVREAPTEIREAYEFAARRPDVLHYMPCFCGCWRAGHHSNYDCFIDEVHADGKVDIDEMGFT